MKNSLPWLSNGGDLATSQGLVAQQRRFLKGKGRKGRQEKWREDSIK